MILWTEPRKPRRTVSRAEVVVGSALMVAAIVAAAVWLALTL